MTTTLQVVQAFDTYKAGDQLPLPDAVAQALQRAYPGRFSFVSSDNTGSVGSSTPPSSGTGTNPPSTGTSLTLADVDGEIASALTAKGLPPGTTVPGLIAAAGTGSGISAAQAAALALALG